MGYISLPLTASGLALTTCTASSHLLGRISNSLDGHEAQNQHGSLSVGVNDWSLLIRHEGPVSDI